MTALKLTRLLFLSAFLPAFLNACATVPYTGRQRLSMVPESSETSMGYQAFGDIKRQYKISHDPKMNDMAKRVGWRIAEAVNRPDFKWEFVVFEEDKIDNAFCLPGGKVGIFTGMFKYIKSDPDLATIIAHEAGHVLARHAGERMSQGLLADLAGLGLSVGLSSVGVNPYAGRAIMQAYGLGATVGVILPYSRRQEYEADHLGLILMAKAGYDPEKAVEFWKRWTSEQKDRSKMPQFLSTHPSDENRIQAMGRLLPEAKRYYLVQPEDPKTTPPPAATAQATGFQWTKPEGNPNRPAPAK
jgi:predicted Zn-dependent protease